MLGAAGFASIFHLRGPWGGGHSDDPTEGSQLLALALVSWFPRGQALMNLLALRHRSCRSRQAIVNSEFFHSSFPWVLGENRMPNLS